MVKSVSGGSVFFLHHCGKIHDGGLCLKYAARPLFCCLPQSYGGFGKMIVRRILSVLVIKYKCK
jgi:hypothetical protein